MGLDAVEIVMRTEDEFGIILSDDEAGSVRTVDDLHQLVLGKLDMPPPVFQARPFIVYGRPSSLACKFPAGRSVRHPIWNRFCENLTAGISGTRLQATSISIFLVCVTPDDGGRYSFVSVRFWPRFLS
jgi:hypothetical protein